MCQEFSGVCCPCCGSVGGGVVRGMGSRESHLLGVGKGSVTVSEPAWSWKLGGCCRAEPWVGDGCGNADEHQSVETAQAERLSHP